MGDCIVQRKRTRFPPSRPEFDSRRRLVSGRQIDRQWDRTKKNWNLWFPSYKSEPKKFWLFQFLKIARISILESKATKLSWVEIMPSFFWTNKKLGFGEFKKTSPAWLITLLRNWSHTIFELIKLLKESDILHVSRGCLGLWQPRKTL